MITLTQRQAVKLGLGGFNQAALSFGSAPRFSHFAHRNPNTPKSRSLRIARIGAFDTGTEDGRCKHSWLFARFPRILVA